jgi:hypothetical protein
MSLQDYWYDNEMGNYKYDALGNVDTIGVPGLQSSMCTDLG